ncbi:hypothetical protein JCGZ_25225 [Jatropha curcas]|uniref:Uncharacterized protein n=1 Tax=Jatropha curcas TaxID=180498 RepID=A0A067LFX9_JATCU|nr:uncharacterized protein LOC105629150 [Jatropha curcas]KDP43039.1 hypothetical protein JCGZ_25225 [Jatropha curcas]
MSSISEELMIDQLVRDYYESESSATPSNFLSSSKPFHQSILQDILLEATDFETQILEKVLMYIRNMGEPNSLKKWVLVRLQMDGYKASLCKNSSVNLSTFGHSKVFQFAGDYEYIEVMMMEKKNGNKLTRVIVDMDFRSQFELARPTQTYKELINTTVPSIFVGTEDRVKRTISILCSAAKDSFKEKGLHFPPWRKAKHMQLKWFSKNCKKISDLSSTEMGMEEDVEKDNINTTVTAKCCPSIF